MIIKKITLVVLFFISSAHAKNTSGSAEMHFRNPASEIILSSKCSNELEKALMGFTKFDHLIKQVSPDPETEIYRLQTGTFGKWIELQFKKAGYPTFNVVTNKSIIEHTFNSKCEITTNTKAGFDFSKTYPDSGTKFVGDAEISKLIKKDITGIIYIWSPDMQYSAKYLKQFRDTAKELNIKFVSILDPRASNVNQGLMSKEFGIPETDMKLNSVELFMRGGTIHYPSIFIFKKGNLTPTLLSGVYDKDTLKYELNLVLGSAL